MMLMRLLRRNKQHMYYCLLVGKQPQYVLENGNKVIDRVTSDGTVLYKVTGKTELVYSEPQGFMGNISMSSGEVYETEFGVDVSNYDAVLITNKDELPITETSLLWFNNEPTYKDQDKTIIDGSKADYKVLQVKPSLNQTKYILGRINK